MNRFCESSCFANSVGQPKRHLLSLSRGLGLSLGLWLTLGGLTEVQAKDVGVEVFPSLTLSQVTAQEGAAVSTTASANRFGQLLRSGEALQKVPDAVLERQTGRYAGQPMIAAATFQLLSNWRLQDQSVLSAGARLQFDLTGKVPQVSISTVANVNASAGHSGTANLPGNTNIVSSQSPLEGVRGAAQAIQIAGDRNAVINNLVLELQPASNLAIGASLTPNAQASNGDLQAQANIDASGLQIKLTDGGAGVVRQSIGSSGGASFSGSGIHQAVQLNSAANVVNNTASLSLQMGSANVAAPLDAGLRAALNQIIGLGAR